MINALSQLISSLSGIQKTIGNTDLSIDKLGFDSREMKAGCLFVAVKGTERDGHEYIDTAIQQGATVIVCEILPAILPDITYIQVNDSALALGELCDAYFEHPSSKMQVVGITGTNGKTTTATLLYHLFQKLGYRVGLLSTVVNYINDRNIPSTHTTPDPLQLNQMMYDMVADGCTYCFMEVSSHAIAQQRIAGLIFRGGVFSNLTLDHLDFHKTFAAYLKAKKTFFDHLPSTAFALVNKDDKNGLVMVQNTAATVKTYALKHMADFTCKILSHHFEGMDLEINRAPVFVRFIGDFNAYNLLAVYGAAVLLGADPQTVLTLLSTLTPVSGRFEYFISSKGVTAVVDYAHTPDAVENVLTALHQLLSKPTQQIITVLGAGGNRDKSKRPIMAQVAARNSSKVILTSDNPRNEDPEAILKDMQAGLDPDTQRQKVTTIVDRRSAIQTAFLIAQPDDIILIAGKGHEDYQIIKGVKYHFDDREEVSKYL